MSKKITKGQDKSKSVKNIMKCSYEHLISLYKNLSPEIIKYIDEAYCDECKILYSRAINQDYKKIEKLTSLKNKHVLPNMLPHYGEDSSEHDNDIKLKKLNNEIDIYCARLQVMGTTYRDEIAKKDKLNFCTFKNQSDGHIKRDKSGNPILISVYEDLRVYKQRQCESNILTRALLGMMQDGSPEIEKLKHNNIINEYLDTMIRTLSEDEIINVIQGGLYSEEDIANIYSNSNLYVPNNPRPLQTYSTEFELELIDTLENSNAYINSNSSSTSNLTSNSNSSIISNSTYDFEEENESIVNTNIELQDEQDTCIIYEMNEDENELDEIYGYKIAIDLQPSEYSKKNFIKGQHRIILDDEIER